MQRLVDAAPAGLDGAANLLADVVLPQVDRAQALIDENPSSQTHGCADRTYWYYRTLTNFPGATWQQLMLAFAALYRAPHPANPHHLAPHTAGIVDALLGFWVRMQHRDGAFDEWYLNERSYCPTAITGAGAALTLLLMGDAVAPATRGAALTALERACTWLEPRYNADVMNQNLAAAAALQGLAHLLPGSRWERVAAAKLARIHRDQTAEGWFPEYGGMDFGYSTLALDLLAVCSVLGGGARVGEMAQRLSVLLRQVCGAGVSMPGRLGSRGTSHGFVFGALHFAATDSSAAAVAERLLGGIARQVLARPASVDDRYFAYFYLPQFALAFRHAARAAAAEVPVAQSDALTDLTACGLAIFRRTGWSVTVSRRLGGAIAVERNDGPPLYHLGYEVTTSDRTRFSSAAWNTNGGFQPVANDTAIEIAAPFRAASSGVPLRRWMIPFQVVVHALVSSGLAATFQALIKRRMIAPTRASPLRLERHIETGAGGVRIRDTLIVAASAWRATSLRVATAISMHSPSGRQDPAGALSDGQLMQQACERLNHDGRAVLRWTWQPGLERLTPALESGSATAPAQAEAS